MQNLKVGERRKASPPSARTHVVERDARRAVGVVLGRGRLCQEGLDVGGGVDGL